MRVPLSLFAAILIAGCTQADSLGPCVVVSTSYPGASAQIVADTVAAPIEQQINGVEQMEWIESEARNDGTYVATIRFKRNADPAIALALVQNRVALAEPILPEEVKRRGLKTSIKPPANANDVVAIALIDQGENGRDSLRKLADAIAKRITDTAALTKVEIFPPPDEDQVNLHIDREKCVAHGVTLNEVMAAAEKFLKAEQIGELRKVHVKRNVLLNDLATINLVKGPSAAYRVELAAAMRISGSPPAGKSVAAAAANCAEIAVAERQRLNLGAIVILDVSEK